MHLQASLSWSCITCGGSQGPRLAADRTQVWIAQPGSLSDTRGGRGTCGIMCPSSQDADPHSQGFQQERASARPVCLPEQLPHPLHRGMGGQEVGGQQWWCLGSLKTHPFAFVFQRSIWLINGKCGKHRKAQRGNPPPPEITTGNILAYSV